MTRGGRDKGRDTPERHCIVTRITAPKSDLIRFVLSPDGVVTPDILGKLPGRGFYTAADRKTVENAIGKKLFARAAKAQATIPDGLADLVDQGLAKNLITLISLARRNGSAICGYEKVKSLMNSTDSSLLLQADDGSERQKTKIRPPRDAKRAFSCLSGQELGLAFGREAVIHAAIAAGGLSGRIQAEAARLSGYRNCSENSQGNKSGREAGTKGK